MEKFQLCNGLQVVNAGYSEDYAACLGFSIGDMNVSEKGLAYLFVRMLLLQKKDVIPYYGGVSTAFCVSGEDIDELLEKLCDAVKVAITQDCLERAKAEINQMVTGTKMAVQQEMRFLFRSLVVGSECSGVDASVAEHINSYSVDDVKAFMNRYYTASNAILLLAGPDDVFYTSRSMVEKLFSQMNRGEKQGGFIKKSYCGGYRHINTFDDVNRLMLGWDLSKFSTEGNCAVVSMLQVFAKELESAYISNHLYNIAIDIRLVSFFGINFMRVMVHSKNADLYLLSDVICGVVEKMCLENYTGDTSFRRLNFTSEGLSKAVDFVEDRLFEIFDCVSGQIEPPSYDDNNEVMSGDDIKLVARRFFLGSKPTCVSGSKPEGNIGLEQRLNDFFQNLGKKL